MEKYVYPLLMLFVPNGALVVDIVPVGKAKLVSAEVVWLAPLVQTTVPPKVFSKIVTVGAPSLY